MARVAARTEGGRFRPLWVLAYRALAAVVAGFFSRRADDVTVYVRGSVAEGDAVLGVSDLDLIVVCRDGDRSCLERRWRRLGRQLPVLGTVVRPIVYSDTELREAAAASALTHDLAAAHPRALFHAAAPDFWLRLRPGLGVPGESWRRVSGRERRPLARVSMGAERWVAAWLELQCWWREAIWGLGDPDPHRSAWLAVKLVAEPVRAWFWAVHGERPASRVEALERGLQALPEEEPTLRRALELRRSPEPADTFPLRDVLPWLVRFSGRLADLMGADADATGSTTIALAGADAAPASGPGANGFEGRLRPLADPRALLLPALPDEMLAVVDGDVGDADALAAAAARESGDVQPAMPAGPVVVMPSAEMKERPPRVALRCVHCRVTDPVTFALLAGSRAARFPEIRGLAARDLARRSVAEHRAFLCGRSDGELRAVGRLFTAARAALFLESFETGEPEICVTLAAVANRLGGSGSRGPIEEVEGAYRAARRAGGTAVAGPVAELARIVRALAPYRED